MRRSSFLVRSCSRWHLWRTALQHPIEEQKKRKGARPAPALASDEKITSGWREGYFVYAGDPQGQRLPAYQVPLRTSRHCDCT